MNLIDKFKNLLFQDAMPVACTDVKTKDGAKILSIEGETIPGSKINEVLTDGSKAPVEPGEYVLEDGSKLIVKEAGIISEISQAENMDTAESDSDAPVVESPMAAAPAVEAEAPAEQANEDKEVSDIKARLDAIEKVLSALADKMASDNATESAMAEVKKQNRDLKGQVKELANQPAAAKTDFKKTDKVEVEEVERIKANKFEHFSKSKIKPNMIEELRAEIASKKIN